MKYTKSTIITIILILFVAFIYFLVSRKTEPTPFDPAYSVYISAYTSGNVSKESVVRVRLATEVPKEVLDALNGQNLFSFSPSVNGQTRWIDAYSVEFVPEHLLQSGVLYEANFMLDKVLSVPKELKTFTFNFHVIVQSFDVQVDGLKAFDKSTLNWQRLFGSVMTADVESPENIEKIIKASQNGKALPIRWEVDGSRKLFRFTVDSIQRGDAASIVNLAWDGKIINVDYTGSKETTVPALGDFILVDKKIFYDPEQYLLLQFSDPLLESQNLDGLIRLVGIENLRFSIIDNEVRVYAGQRISGSIEVVIEKGVQNIMKYKLKEPITFVASFEELLPAVKLINQGVILPNTGKFSIPFDAVNLRAVDVKVLKIFENNIQQFLQVNSLAGNYELRRVGKLVAKKTINIDTDKILDLHKWNRFTLDMSDLVKAEPGAIYQITIGFKQDYSLYNCKNANANIVKSDDDDEEYGDDESEYYYGSGNEDDYEADDYNTYFYPKGYRWDQKDNPCHVSYYSSSRWVTQNILASNLGLIAKKGNDGKMLLVVNDLITTKPVARASVEVYDYQQQLIYKGKTNNEGIAEVDTKEKPFLFIAQDGSQKGYLRLDDGSSLSFSKFDVSGDEVQSGIKGFIYGERGVWRPGDTLHLMFILEDKQKSIPANHPVSFEFFNPLGQLVTKTIRAESNDGIYKFQTTTASDAPTGNWNVKVKVGGVTFQKSLRIETIMPNRLKLKLDFGDAIYKDKANTGMLQVNWLHGAVAKNLKAKVDVTLQSQKTSFSKYTNYIFDDPTRVFDSESITLFEKEIDEKGQAKIIPKFEKEDAPGILNAVFITKVFEPGGEFSIDKFSVPYYPYSTFIGIKVPTNEKSREYIYTDTTHAVNIVAVDQTGKAIKGKMDVEVELYKLDWRWWWDRSEENLTNYNTAAYRKPLKRETVTLADGQGIFNFRINYPEWGRYLVRVCDNVGGHCTGQTIYVDWGSAYAKKTKSQPDGVTNLNFTSDKTTYKVGEDVNLSIPTGSDGRAFVSLESGSRVLKTFWLDVKQGQTEYSFKATKEMTPNIYVYVALLQPHAQTVNDLPMRMYGVIPILIEDPATKLQPLIGMKDAIRPEEKSNITVSEKTGNEMSYTIAIVDEGLLDLTRFKTPDPWNHFYAREALGVKTWDLYDNVIGAWNAQLERIFSIGGDDYKKPVNDNKAKRFKPVVIFLGPFHLAKGEKKTHDFVMPQYVGSVRAMVVASHEGAYGQAEKTVAVRKPLMLLATLPRVVGPGESVNLPVSVFAMEKSIKNVSLEILPNQFFTVEGEKNVNVEFSEIGDQTIDFHLKVKSVLGIAKVKVIAKSGTEKAEYDIELDVRNPNPVITEVNDTLIVAGQNISLSYKPLGMAGTNKGMIEVSSFPPINLGNRLEYLIHYPYGCVEQTTSSVFPQLFLSQFIDLSPARKSEIETNIKAGILRLSTFQVPEGGLAYWPGNPRADEWGSTYAGHFMIEAQLLGYNLPPAFLEQWKRYQRQKAISWTYDKYERSPLMQAYRLYTLALAKSPEFGAMNRLKELSGISIETKWCLAAAYQLAGQGDIAKLITAQIGTTVKPYKELGTTYGSDLRDKAMILEALSLMGENTKAAPLMKEMAARLSSPEWLSTQTTSYCLIAIAKFISKNSISEKLNYSYKINNVSQNVSSISPFSQIILTMSGAKAGLVEIENKSKGMLFARLILSGQPESGSNITASNSNLNIEVEYKTMDGVALDISKIKQGTDFIAEVNVFNPGIKGDYEQMALSQIFPSGWEIHNTRLFGTDNKLKPSVFTYQDIRDDRVYTYFDIKKNLRHTYYVFLNASYTGRYFMPSTYCEAMYDASISSRIPGKWVEVVK